MKSLVASCLSINKHAGGEGGDRVFWPNWGVVQVVSCLARSQSLALNASVRERRVKSSGAQSLWPSYIHNAYRPTSMLRDRTRLLSDLSSFSVSLTHRRFVNVSMRFLRSSSDRINLSLNTSFTGSYMLLICVTCPHLIQAQPPSKHCDVWTATRSDDPQSSYGSYVYVSFP